MADAVHYRLERMLPELDDLEKRGLFSKQEIIEIAKRRRKFEYRLKRPSPLKQDFLEYIEYEIQLDSLRRLRKKGDQSKKKRSETSVSDFAGIARVIDIYRLAVSRFKADLDLWFRYLEFCRTRRNGRMKKVLAQVIRFHPKVPGIWIYAAAWEFDQNLNVVAARALMQNGLRLCPTSEELWVEYLRMELTYLNKLKARKVALGEETRLLARVDGDKDDKQWISDNKELYMPFEDEKGAKGHVNSDDSESEKEIAKDLFQLQGLKVLKTIYAGAVEAIPDSFDLRKRLFYILEAVDLGCADDIRKEILNDMRCRFAMDSKYWDWLARLDFVSSDSELNVRFESAVKVYEEALQTLTSPTMFKIYSKFLMEFFMEKEECDSLPLRSSIGSCLSQLINVYEKAEKLNCIDSELACEYVVFYLKLGRFNEAQKIADSLCSRNMSNSISLCILKVTLDLRCLTRGCENSKEHAASIFEFLTGLLSRSPVSEVADLWKMAFKLFATEKKYIRTLVDMAYTMIAKQGGADNGFHLPSMIVNFVVQKDGITQARDLYKRFLALPHPGLALYRCCIELEENLASVGDVDCLVNARKLYDNALVVYNQNADLWKAYYAMELKLGTAETSNAVYWRARKVLGSLSEFSSATCST